MRDDFIYTYILGFCLVCVFCLFERTKQSRKKNAGIAVSSVKVERLVYFTCIHLPFFELAFSTWDESSDTAMSYLLFLLIIINIMFQTEENDKKTIF